MGDHLHLQPHLPQVGVMDTELKNSPVAWEFDDNSDTVRQQLSEEEQVCFFNGREFGHRSCVSSGTQVLQCRHGVWVEMGSSDPGNP